MSLLTAPDWQQSGDALFCAVVQGRARARYQLRVETLSGGRWRWSAWCLVDPSAFRHGEAGRLSSALEKARLAAHSLALAAQAEADSGSPGVRAGGEPGRPAMLTRLDARQERHHPPRAAPIARG